ncbi:MAG TPA: trehalose-phosphatase [Candidatus Udaeobacter sp.]|jgi:trehalose-phosphatase|nr:trehalose-phosphatase [Candidatus Udaeobacter sp.]
MILSALEHINEIARSGNRLAVFIDYDGTLTPIVSRPEEAWLSESMRQTLRTLAARLPVAILTGRDLDDVRGRVHVDGIVYAGSHGFDIAGAGGLRRELGAAFLPVLDTAEAELREALDDIAGAQLERKHFSVAAHYRNVNESDASGIAQAVDAVARKHRELRKINGKKVYELLPDIDWNKGRAVLWLLETLELEGGEAFPIFIGDDRTDEDAFSALKERGAGILVSEQPQVTAANYWLRNPEDVERFLQELIVRLPG